MTCFGRVGLRIRNGVGGGLNSECFEVVLSFSNFMEINHISPPQEIQTETKCPITAQSLTCLSYPK